MSNLVKLLKEHFWGVLLLVVLLIGSSISVKIWKAKHPGAMTVLESQAMDMTVMKPPVGAVPVATEIVHLGHFTSKITYTGSVAPFQEQIIYSRVEGWIKNMSIYNGDRVSANQLIATVDSPDLQNKVAEAAASRAIAISEVPKAQYGAAQMAAESAAAKGEVESANSELARAKAMVKASQKAVAQRENEVKSAKANLEYWKAEIAREEKLLKSGAVSLQEFQAEQAQAIAAEAEYENKLAMLAEASANVTAAQADVKSKQAMVYVANQRVSATTAATKGASAEVLQKSAMVRQADAMVATASTIADYRFIRAPFAGLVTQRISSPGQFVTPSTPIANIVQTDQVRLQVNVSDKDLAGIKVGDGVIARFVKDPDLTIESVISSISPLADQFSRTAIVEALVSNKNHKLVPGDAVTMEISVSGYSDVISVPSSAIVSKDGKPAVWIVRTEAPEGKMLYYCTMHPEVVQDHPGDCPKCNMKLVPKTSDGNKKAHLVTVTTGPSSGDRIAITSGIHDGDEVIYQGNTYLKEGDIVYPTSWGPQGPEEMPQAPGANNMSEMDNMPGMHDSSHYMKNMPDAKSVSPKKISKDNSSRPLYQCPMHPQQTSHNPHDRCKICGMKINQPVRK